MFKKIATVRPLPNGILRVWFCGGEVKDYNVPENTKQWAPFAALQDETLFARAHVDAGGYGVAWNNDIDLSCNELWERGVAVDVVAGAKAALLGEVAEVRKRAGTSQKQLEEATGVKQPVIARLEKGETAPQLDTMLKVLAPLGKTLKIVDA